MNEQAWKEQAARVLCGADSCWDYDTLPEQRSEISATEDSFCKDYWRKLAAALYPIVQQAIAAERERCAKVAEDWNIDWARPSGYMPDDIAAAIRSLKEADNGAGNECICPKCGLRHGGKVDSGAVF